MTFFGTQGAAAFGANGSFGSLMLRDDTAQDRLLVQVSGITGLNGAGTQMFQLNATTGTLRLMSGGQPTIMLIGSQARLTMGDNGQTGDLYLKGSDGTTRVRVNGQQARLSLYDDSGNLRAALGPQGGHWTLRLVDDKGRSLATLGRNGNLTLGGGERKDHGYDGDLIVRDKEGRDRIQLDGDAGDILLKNQGGSTTIKLDGDAGDVVLFNADCAEEFDIDDDGAGVGSVMVAGEGMCLRRGARPYDRRVVGVVAGAGSYRPGLVLGHRESQQRRVPIAVLGRVCCLADASHGAIDVGDLLTTSTTIGHAMRVTDHPAAMGAVIGKALSPLPAGCGLVEILVSLR